MAALRTLLCLVFAALAAVCGPAAAQLSVPGANPSPTTPPRGAWLPGGKSYLGLQMGRAAGTAACTPSSLFCDDAIGRTELHAGTMIGGFWGVEVGLLDLGRPLRASEGVRGQGLSLSLVGKTQIARTVGVFGRLGTTYGNESVALGTNVMGAGPDQGFGLAYGAGLSFDFTPRLSATVEFDSRDWRFTGGRDPVRSTSLGLQFRY
ncbi:MAG TPA: outer membrane beta-barrel protein [Ramlibacter sp.]|nr:outer membrane beta-barrel protein [Ramlibacter sp.]